MADPLILGCPTCGAERNKKCRTLSQRPALTKPHVSRRQLVDKFVREEYCRNEVMSGYGCGVDGCPHCGGLVFCTGDL